MKKTLLTITSIAALTISVNAQTVIEGSNILTFKGWSTGSSNHDQYNLSTDTKLPNMLSASGQTHGWTYVNNILHRAADVNGDGAIDIYTGSTATPNIVADGLVEATALDIAWNPITNEFLQMGQLDGAGNKDIWRLDGGVNPYNANGLSDLGSLAFDYSPNGVLYRIGDYSGDLQLYSGSTATPNTIITGLDSATQTFGITTSPVPEPSSTALLGLGGLAFIMRRRR